MLFKNKITISLIITAILLLVFSYVINAQQVIDVNRSATRPNIVWIVCEDMSPHLSCFGETAIQTPSLDALAKDGVKYTNVYTVAGVCAPSRNGIITGMYPMSIGGDNMRNYQPVKKNDEAVEGILPSYSIVPPDYVKCFPEFLRKEMYYCTNTPKEDYQFQAPVTAWDESSGKKAHWKNRPNGKPFFAVFNLNVTHESQIWVRDSLPLDVDPATVIVPPYYPDIPEVRQAIARNLSNVKEMDRQAGKLIQELKDSGLYNNTIIFFYSDHGDGLPYVKREITKRGLHIPLIIKFPNQENSGKTDDQMISAIDLGPTVLSLAGVPIPQYMHGQAFLGSQKKQERKYIFASRDRMDEQVDRVRTMYDGRYQYLRNYMPEKPYYQDIKYRYQIPMMKKMIEMWDAGKLNAVQMRWFKPKVGVEELYDTEKDPYELNNLSANPSFKQKLTELRDAYNKWMEETGDKNATPEKELLTQMWDGKDKAPVTATPALLKMKDGYIIACNTAGASIGFKVTKAGNTKSADNWKIYNYDIIDLKEGDEITIRAQRIGYLSSELQLTVKQ